jgi:hypothetical protein
MFGVSGCLAAIVIALGTALTAAPLRWVMTAVFLFFASFPADTIREAERLKTRDVQTTLDIDSAAHVLAQWSPSPRRLSTTRWAACWRWKRSS